MNTPTEKLMGAQIVAQAIIWVGAIIACAITLNDDTHAIWIILTLACSGGMSLVILVFTAFEMAKKGKGNHDA
jgi:peptidoglycan/LPS O-acetylase OafA/YrhL